MLLSEALGVPPVRFYTERNGSRGEEPMGKTEGRDRHSPQSSKAVNAKSYMLAHGWMHIMRSSS